MKIYTYLHNHPHFGIISGFVSGSVLFIRQLFTDDATIKLVAGIGAWAGALVAVLSAVIWSIKVYDAFKSHFKNQ